MQSFDALISGTLRGHGKLPAATADDAADLVGWLRRRLAWLLESVPLPWTLVLDNHQEMPGDSPVHLALSTLMDELPRGAQWIVVSREPPAAAYSRPLLQQHLAIVDAGHLRFDDTEARELVRLHGRADTMAAALSPARGWAAGMTLILMGEGHGAAVPTLDARARLFDYFADEVLSRMPGKEQRALCALAYVPSISSDLAIAVTGFEQAHSLLERLSAHSLFTERRDEPVAFTFHDLFGEFLRRRFERTATPDQLRAVRLHVGRLLVEAGQVDAGLRHLIDAAAWPEAEACIRNAAPDLVDHGRTHALSRLIADMPPDVANRLAYWRGICVLDNDPEAAIADMVRVWDRAEGVADRLAAAAGAAIALIAAGRVSELDRWLAALDGHAVAAIDSRGAGFEARIVPGLLAMVVYRAPWHPQADALAERAEQLLHRDSASGEKLLLGSLAFHLLWRGQVDRLERLLLRIDALCAQPMVLPVTLFRWWSVGIVVKTLLGHCASAQADAERALATVAAEPSLKRRETTVRLLAMFVALGQGAAQSARVHLDRAARTLRPDDAADLTMYEQQHGVLAMLEDDRPTALRLMRAAVRSAHRGGFPMREHIALIAHSLAAAHAGEHDEAATLLQQAMAHPFLGTGGWHQWVAGIAAAYVALRRGDDAEMSDRLRAALKVARECGFRHGPMLFCCGDMMARLMAIALAQGIESDVARDIVVRHQLRAPSEAGASWPWPVRLRALGPLEIEVGGTPQASSRKESRRLIELLAILLAGGATATPVDVIADELWPDADGDAARNALDNALHRLRKSLGGDDRILLRHGTLFLNPERCWWDTRALDLLLARIETTPAAALPALEKSIVELYRAPLLAAEAGTRVTGRRASLETRVQRALSVAVRRAHAAGIRQADDIARSTAQSLPDP